MGTPWRRSPDRRGARRRRRERSAERMVRRGCLESRSRASGTMRPGGLDVGMIRGSKRTSWNTDALCDTSELHLESGLAPGSETFLARRNGEQLALSRCQRALRGLPLEPSDWRVVDEEGVQSRTEVGHGRRDEGVDPECCWEGFCRRVSFVSRYGRKGHSTHGCSLQASGLKETRKAPRRPSWDVACQDRGGQKPGCKEEAAPRLFNRMSTC